MGVIFDSLLVVIRASGERTIEKCCAALSDITTSHVHTLNLSPFSTALRESLRVGIESNKKWLLIIDADILVSLKGIHQLFEFAERTPEHFFQIQGLVLDKFFDVFRPAGNHLYRTQFAEKALDMIPQEGTSLRPETDMLNSMAKSGFPWIQCDAKVGIHDYEQYYADIYRKSFLQAHKHNWLLNDLEHFWRGESGYDLDYQVALWGALSGKTYDGTVLVDKRFLEGEAEEVLQLKRIDEKPPLRCDDLHGFVRTTLEAYETHPQTVLQELIFPNTRWNKVHDAASFEQPAVKKNGVVHRAGDYLIRLGKKLKRF